MLFRALETSPVYACPIVLTTWFLVLLIKASKIFWSMKIMQNKSLFFWSAIDKPSSIQWKLTIMRSDNKILDILYMYKVSNYFIQSQWNQCALTDNKISGSQGSCYNALPLYKSKTWPISHGFQNVLLNLIFRYMYTLLLNSPVCLYIDWH